MKLIKDCLTGKDGQTYDIGRVLWIVGIFAFIGLTIYSIFRGGSFDPMNWGTGYGAMLAGGGGGIGWKARTEPEQ